MSQVPPPGQDSGQEFAAGTAWPGVREQLRLELSQGLLESLRIVAVNSQDIPDDGGLWTLDSDGEYAVIVGTVVLFHHRARCAPDTDHPSDGIG